MHFLKENQENCLQSLPFVSTKRRLQPCDAGHVPWEGGGRLQGVHDPRPGKHQLHHRGSHRQDGLEHLQICTKDEL